MSGRRDMFNILNVRMDDRTYVTPPLHHTGDAAAKHRHIADELAAESRSGCPSIVERVIGGGGRER